MRVEESGDAAPGISRGFLVLLRPRDASQEPEHQGGIGGVVIVHEAMTGTGIDLHVVRYFELGEQPAEPLPGTPAQG
jgi:hypothetical protein